MRALIRDQVTNRVVRRGDPISPRQKISVPVSGALYHYLTTTSQNPPPGWIYAASGGLLLRINATDADGRYHGESIPALKAGDTISIGANTGTVQDPPINSGPGVFSVAVDVWPVLANGDYTVTVVIS